MDELFYKTSLIGLAAFLHDIGKPYQRTGIPLPSDYGKNTIERQLILNKDSHIHALHTAHFFEKHINNNLIHRQWQETFKETGMMIASAGHHNPGEDYIKKLISTADQIASGFDRVEYERSQKKGRFDYRKVMMVPLLKLVSLYKNSKDDYRYRLNPVNLESIFPVHKNDIANVKAEEEYKKIVSFFESGLKKLEQLSLKHYIDGLISLYEESFSFVPASTMGDYDDVSLYDHSKTTAAFASALYKITEDSKIFPKDTEKVFLVIRGEFFGIQKFIFSEGAESGKNPSKILRGRSFYISLITEIISELVLRELNLPSFNLMLNAAGMFVILADNSEDTKEKVKAVTQKVNDWLFDKFFGEVYFGIAHTETSSTDFTEKHFETVWLDLLSEMEKVKNNRFNLAVRDAVFKDHHKQFNGRNVCELCGREASEKDSEHGKICEELIELGKNLVDKNKKYIIVSQRVDGRLFGYDYEFASSVDFSKFSAETKVIDISLFGTFSGFYKSKINTYVATDGYTIKTFEDLSKGNGGVDLLGVFKADVDNLASIFAVGLEKEGNEGENKRLTFSRISQLSRMINNFFAYYLPDKLRKDYPDTYTVFAGGDDLFLIGRYDKMFDLSLVISEDFKRYSGFNEEVTISGGIAVFKPNTPVAFMAEVVEDNLSKSKKLFGSDHVKSKLTFLGASASWLEFKNIHNEISNINDIIPGSSSFSYKLLQLIEMRLKLNNLNGNKYPIDELSKNIMWLPRLKYLLARQIKSQTDRDNLSQFFLSNIENRPSILRSMSMFQIYKNRKKGGIK